MRSSKFLMTLRSIFASLAVASTAVAEPPAAPGWKVELLAEAPAINHPSVVCSAPDGRVFVAEDPMDIRADVPASAARGRIVCLHPDGHTTVFAERLHAVFGMQYLEGKLYVLHNPKFSVFTDVDGVGKARTELIEQTNPNPWALDWNDHVPANFRLAMDGWFYIAVGDKGLFGARGTDGRTLNLHGGGIVRIRPDGTGLELFSTGVRNILDVALGAEDDIFTYDNTDEHDWMGRLTHMVERGAYGYPHDFVPRRPYTLWMMHDFGGGAATGLECYTGDALPAEFRGNLFLADFGKRQVIRAQIERAGATWRVVKSAELFPNPPEDFRPVGIAWTADERGLLVCDWQHRDEKANVQAGRVWRATFTGAAVAERPAWFVAAASGREFSATDAELLAALGHPSRSVRLTAQRRLAERKSAQPALMALLKNPAAPSPARQHALWALDGDADARTEIIELVKGDADLAVRRQAARVLGLRRVAESAEALAAVVRDASADASLRFHAATALGRIRDETAIPALIGALDQADSFARFAAFTALNEIGRAHPGAWASIAACLENGNAQIREAAAFALRDSFDAKLVDALAALAAVSKDPAVRETALRLLAPLVRQQPEWKGEWWAYHPALVPPPKGTVEWPGTKPVLAALTAALADAAPAVRLAAIEGLQAADARDAAPALRELFASEPDAAVRRAALRTLATFKDTATAPLVAALLHQPPADVELVREAIRAAGTFGDKEAAAALAQLVRSGHAARAEAIAALSTVRDADSLPAFSAALGDSDAAVRLAAIKALGESKHADALTALRPVLESKSPDERPALARALGNFSQPEAVPLLLRLWSEKDTRTDALASLARHGDARALDAYLDGLASANPSVREQCRKALGGIRAEVLTPLEARAATLAPVVLAELREVYRDDDAAKKGPLFASTGKMPSPEDYARFALETPGDIVRGQRVFFDEAGVGCLRCHQVNGHGAAVGPEMTTIGAQFPRREFVDAILNPGKTVREGYQLFVIETRDGQTHAGMIRSENADTLTLVDAAGQSQTFAKRDIATRTGSQLSLMPQGLHAGLTLEQFADLTAFLESRKTDPRKAEPKPAPEGWTDLLSASHKDAPTGWRELPAGTTRADAAAIQRGVTPTHWLLKDGVLEHDGVTGDLWTEREFGDFDLTLDWRWSGPPKWEEFPLINADGLEAGPDGRAATQRVLDAGDSGVLLRGLYKAQANFFCYPVGSGEFWEYRTDPNSTREQRRAFTPRASADRPIGDWNTMRITLRGDRVTVAVNGEEVIASAELPGIPASGPVGLQHEHGRIQFRNVFIREIAR